MATVKDIDLGFNGIIAATSEFAKSYVVVGWIEGKKDQRSGEASGTNVVPDITNPELATVHEYGTSDGRIPEGRLGFREWADRHGREIGDQIIAAYQRSIKPGGNAKSELNKLGSWAVADWRKYLRDVQPGPELAASTKDAKLKKLGSKKAEANKKLIDTAQLINGSSYQVRSKAAG